MHNVRKWNRNGIEIFKYIFCIRVFMQQAELDYFGVPVHGDADRFFINSNVFSSSYFPPALPGREKQISEIKSYIAGFQHRNQHLYITGRSGTGKTATIKEVLLNDVPNEFNIIDRDNQKAVFSYDGKKGVIVYVNCRRNITKLKLAKSIASIVSGKPMIYRGFDDAMEGIGNQTRDYDFFIVVLDEINVLNDRNNDVIYHFSRWGDDYKTILSLVLISNKINFMEGLDSSVASSYQVDRTIIFPPYNAVELTSILKDRAREGIKDGVLAPDVIPAIASNTARDAGDARLAIQTLKLACETASMMGLDNVDISCVNIAFNRSNAASIISPIRDLSDHEKVCLRAIVDIAKHRGYAYTGEIYERYIKLLDGSRLPPLTQRRISDYINAFDTMGIIHSSETYLGRHGRTKIVRVPQYIELIRKELEKTMVIL